MAKRIDFPSLKSQVRFPQILQHYGITLSGSGEQLSGLCPLPTHPQRTTGKRTPSFSANMEKGIWQCFGCGASGNHIEFFLLMEGLNPDDGQDFRKGALKIRRLFVGASLDESTLGRSADK